MDRGVATLGIDPDMPPGSGENTMSPRIHDWKRVYWRNAKGERVYDPEDINPPDEVLALYENNIGERVGYRYVTDQDEDVPEGATYVVTFDGEIVRDVELEGPNYEGQAFDVLAFGTRKQAREANTDFRNMLRPVPDKEELEEMDWDVLKDLARPRGYTQRDGRDGIIQGLTG